MIIWMVFIFYMSNKNGNDSSEMSNVVIDIMRYLGIDENRVLQNFMEFIVRKSAHILEYCILACLIFNVVKEYNNIIATGVFTLILSVLYATTDEIHQLFIPGRSGKMIDVLIDSIGILLGTAIIYLIHKSKYSRKRIRV